MSEISNERLLEDDEPPAYSENPPAYSEAIKVTAPGSDRFPTPPPSAYGAIDDDSASRCPTAHDPTELPPSYASLFGEIQEARRRSSSVAEFLKDFLVLLLGTLGCTLCLGLILAIPVSMIVIGSYHFHDCKKAEMIPIYLIVSGVVGLLKNLLNLGRKVKAHLWGNNEAARESAKESSLDNLIMIFLVAWFIAGNVWIYRVYMPTPEECNPQLYLFAFWLTTSTYIFFCVLVSCILCAAVCALGNTEPNDNSSA